jgi:hypothetical protein
MILIQLLVVYVQMVVPAILEDVIVVRTLYFESLQQILLELTHAIVIQSYISNKILKENVFVNNLII